MAWQGERSLAALRVLTRSAHLASADDLPGLVADAGAALGAERMVLHVVDLDQVELVPLLDGGRSGPPIAVEGTLAGRAFTEVALQVSAGDTRTTAWMPVIDGTDRLGVLEAVFAGDADEQVCESLQDIAGQVAELVSIRSVYGDAIARARRRLPLTVAAELQWRLLPPLTFVSRRAAVAGILLPTEDIAGDAFDYALNGNRLQVTLIDAMGHGLEAALLAAVAVSSLRSARRRGLDLGAMVRFADDTLAQQFGPDKFVTGVVAELDTASGTWTWASCGHPPALLLRGGKVIKSLDAVVSPPLGLGLFAGSPELGSERLEPRDRLLLYTDGVVEARDDAGEFFGTERLVDLISKQEADGRPAAETLRRLNQAILGHQEGALQDDATTLLVEWLTDEPERSTP